MLVPRQFIAAAMLFLFWGLHSLSAQTPIQDQIYIWPGTAPGSDSVSVVELITDRDPSGGDCYLNRSVSKVTQPSIKHFAPANPNGSAVLLCPGGGYALLAYDKEGYDIAQWFNDRDITAFVLKYRLPIDGHEKREYVPLQDAQRAMRYIRAHADSFGINPDSIGVMGGSAGGHLAASLSVFYDWEVYAPVDSTDSLSARPDFTVLMYPVVSFQDSLTHGGSRNNLLGSGFNEAKKDSFSPELQVDSLTPPAFLFHSLQDGSVNYRNSRAYARALDSVGVSNSLNLYSSGGHGVGKCEAGNSQFSIWPYDLDDWLEAEGWTTACQGDSPVIATFTQNGTLYLRANSNDSIQWYRNGIPLNNANDSIYEPKSLSTYTFSAYGSREGSGSPCLLFSEALTLTSLASNEFTEDGFIRIYPNPAHDKLLISHLPENMAKVGFSIHDARGAQVRGGTKAVLAGGLSLDVSGLQPGFYLLRINTDRQVMSGRFIIK